jgi:hypothetical protein
VNHDILCADFPMGKSPIEESVDPLTIGDRGFVVYENCVRVNRELPSRDIPTLFKREITDGRRRFFRRIPGSIMTVR